MANKFISMKSLKFFLYDLFDVESLTQYSYYQDHDRETFDLVLDTALKISEDLLFPCFSEMDKNPPELVDGEVKVHQAVKSLMKECGEGGWNCATFPYAEGGQQMPGMIMAAFRYILSAANYSASVFPYLSSEAAHLITSFGSQELIDIYAEKMLGGQWQGTMALTEPQAGSSLTDLITTAYPTDKGYYLVKGQKIFISAAEHDGADNVVNLLLARIKGAPPGVKGISLFVVPKKRVTATGELEDNDLVCATIYHKLGYRGTPLTQLSIGENDDCRGWLVGKEHQGLRCMFQMMNDSRVAVGLSAAATASAAFYAALDYTNERPQGRAVTEKDPTRPQIPIIEHADVKRMLLFQRAIVEGSLAICFQCAKYIDLLHVTDGEEKQRLALLLDLLTPVAKSYPSEMGVLSVSQGLQCLGGYGYCDEFPLEQYYRDMRINPIHEGTTGIHGMDLLGRKVIMKNGLAFKYFLEEVEKTIERGRKIDLLTTQAQALEAALEKLKSVSTHLIGLAVQDGSDLFLADATLYLELFGIITAAWQWLLQAVTISKKLAQVTPDSGADYDFYQGKYHTFVFFFEYELPKIEGLVKRLMNSDGLTIKMKPSFFKD